MPNMPNICHFFHGFSVTSLESALCLSQLLPRSSDAKSVAASFLGVANAAKKQARAGFATVWVWLISSSLASPGFC